MVEIKKTGGARIGMANATWPFATLKANKDKLELDATIIGNLVFRPSDIISIEPYRRSAIRNRSEISDRVGSFDVFGIIEIRLYKKTILKRRAFNR